MTTKNKSLLTVTALAIIFFIGWSLIKQPQTTAEETPLENETAIADRHWKKVFFQAFENIDCPAPRDPKSLPDGYYKGPMIDTHVHLQSLPDGTPGLPDDHYVGTNLGIKHTMHEWICMMDVEGTKQAWGFFPVWKPIIQESIDVVKITMDKYPNRFIPFIMPPDNNEPTVVAEKLEEMLNIEPGIFQGYGEIGLYGNPDSPPLAPDSEKLMKIYSVAQKHNLVVYIHLGENHKEALEHAAAANPDVTFIFHGDQLIDCAECDKTPDAVAKILEHHPNVYYGVDELYGNTWLIQPGASKEDFLAHFADYEPLLKKDMDNWKDFIENHPDQVLWGTDRGVSESWDKDPKVALTLNNYVRAFIGKLDPSVQEKFAYKNAEKILSTPQLIPKK